MADTLRYVPGMRASIRWGLPQVAWVVAWIVARRRAVVAPGVAAAAPAVADASGPAKPSKKCPNVGLGRRKGGPGVPGHGDQPARARRGERQPGRLDVAHRRHARAHRPAHRGRQDAAPRWPARSSSSRRPRRFLEEREAARRAHGAPAAKSCCSPPPRAPGTIPEVVAQARRGRGAPVASILDGYTFCLQPKPGGGCAQAR